MNFDQLTSLIWLILLCVVLVFGFTLYPKQNNLENFPKGNFCGTSSLRIGTKAEIGKTIFKHNCAQCHAKNMKSDATGPALQGVFDKWGRDTLSYFTLLNNSSKRPALIKMKKLDLDSSYFLLNHNFSLTYEEVEGLIHYIEL